MVTGVSDYNLTPLTTYPEETGRTTSITSFSDMFQAKLAAMTETEEQTKVSEAQGQSTKASETVADSDKDTGSVGEVIFFDPQTGERVRYVDVAKSKVENNSSAESSKGTTAASSDDSSVKTKYETYFQKAAAKYNVSSSLLKAIAKAESNFNASSVSSAGAMGVMQLMPATAEGLGVKNPYDAKENIMGGAKCISQKLDEFDGNVRLALAAYNAGSGAVRRSGGIPSYCTNYVDKVLGYKADFEKNAVG